MRRRVEENDYHLPYLDVFKIKIRRRGIVNPSSCLDILKIKMGRR